MYLKVNFVPASQLAVTPFLKQSKNYLKLSFHVMSL